MTPEEKQAKLDWGTAACQVRGCTARAAYFAMEMASSSADREEWWQYCCAKHAGQYAERHGLAIPAAAPAAS